MEVFVLRFINIISLLFVIYTYSEDLSPSTASIKRHHRSTSTLIAEYLVYPCRPNDVGPSLVPPKGY